MVPTPASEAINATMGTVIRWWRAGISSSGGPDARRARRREIGRRIPELCRTAKIN
ncbi:hypothetical protein [Streptomyces sp. NPDC014995]|uniref:hypothetical protein n=1 Tax=Streptomyces sp. NPDC014995 TaxID=3364936 RepID=UPI0036FEC33D